MLKLIKREEEIIRFLTKIKEIQSSLASFLTVLPSSSPYLQGN